MMRLFATLLAVLLFSVPARATLVALVPSADGLIVAADSRISFLGAECDGQFKILPLARHARTVVMVTGDSIFIPPPPAGESNICHYIESAPRALDIGAVVRAYLDSKPANPASIPLEGLAQVCVRAVERFQRSAPKALQAYAGREIFSVIIASYEPASHTATLRNFVVRIDAATHQIEAARFANISVGPKDRRGVWIYGETTYVEKYVYAGFGRRFLTGATLNLILVNKPVSETPLRDAAGAAVNVIRAASRATQTVPAPRGIGGAIRVVLLGRQPRPQALPWAAQ